MPLPDDILEPISDENPVGEDLRYDIVYDEIREAREEEEDIPQGEWRRERKTADYRRVVKLATEVLRERSKDLQVAAWLAEGLLMREGFGGFREGIDLMRALMDRFWDGLYPPIDDGDVEFRAVPLEWIGNYFDTTVKRVPLNQAGHDWFTYTAARAIGYEEDVEGDSARAAKREKAIAEGKLTPEEFDEGFDDTPKSWYKDLNADLEAALESLESLEGESDERFGEFAPSFRRLRESMDDVKRVAERLLETKLKQDPDPPEVTEGPTDAGERDLRGAGDVAEEAPTPASASGAGAAPASAATLEPGSWEDAARRVAAAARFLRQEDARSPAPYLMLRGFRWGELRAGDEGVDPRLLEAPPTDARTRLKSLLLDGRWAELLEAAEEVMATPFGRGWLDLQRYVLTALDGLGSEYEMVRRAVRGALADLLRNLPRLPEVTLMDDSPTANRETQRWLREEGIFDAFSEEAQEELESTGRERRAPSVRDVRERALEKVRAGQPRKGIELLLDAADQERSERDRFLRRSEATRIMVEAGLEPVAEPILKQMLQKIEQHDLEEWEAGETIAQPLALLYRCLERSGVDPNQKQDLYLRVCRLDPMQAIHFSSGSGEPDPAAELPEAPGAEAGGDAGA